MRIGDVGDIVGLRAPAPGEARHFRRRHVEEFRRRIEKAAHEPGAGDAVDLRAGARHPARGDARLLERGAGGPPRVESAVEIACGVTPGFERGRGRPRTIAAVRAIDGYGPPRLELLEPGVRLGVSTDRSGQALRGASERLGAS